MFDLDACVWFPEMYHLWGGGGAPFTPMSNGNVQDRAGTEVYLMGSVREILQELKSDPKWEGTHLCLASSCDEPSWARECLSKIVVDPNDGTVIQNLVTVSEIHKGNKQSHLRNIQKETGIPFENMVFFDDQRQNCVSVAKLGVTCYHVPNAGITARAWALMHETFPSPGKVIACE